jgi:hypothetical protein
VNVLTATVNLFTAGVNLFTATVNLFTAAVNLFTATVNLLTAGVNLFTATVNLLTAAVNLLTAAVNLLTASVFLFWILLLENDLLIAAQRFSDPAKPLRRERPEPPAAENRQIESSHVIVATEQSTLYKRATRERKRIYLNLSNKTLAAIPIAWRPAL